MMSSTTENDPFLQVQADVQAQLLTIRPLYTSYLRIRSHSTTSTPSPELTSAHADLTSSLETLSEDLSDLKDSIQAIQRDPYSYGLEIEEVGRRKRFIEGVETEVNGIQEALSNGSPGNGYKNGDDHRRQFDNEEEDNYAEFEHQQQTQIMAEQDQTLTSVFHTVGNLRQQADTMGRELEEQAVMLEVTDELADRVGGRLSTGMEKMKVVIRQNEDGLSSCCIAVLIAVLVFLLVLVLVL